MGNRPKFFRKSVEVAVVSLTMIFLSIGISAQENFRVMFYNVENLFDTKDDPLKDDDEFLPDGKFRWTGRKYWKKLKNITRVITAVGGMHSPALVGLCEVENDSVVFDLTARSPLRAQKYDYIVTDSPDERGIDVALLYQRDQFKLLEKNEYRISFSDPATGPSRNILHAVGQLVNGDTLDVFVCHFPSRSGGQLASEPARKDAALLLRNKTDSLFCCRGQAHIVIMGDFNDHPNDKSLSCVLEAQMLSDEPNESELYNLFYHRIKETDFGTYKFRGQWEVLDQFIVSGNLLSKNASVFLKNNEATVFKADFLLEEDKKGEKRPYRTYMGPVYKGGFSDHLPVFIDLIIK